MAKLNFFAKAKRFALHSLCKNASKHLTSLSAVSYVQVVCLLPLSVFRALLNNLRENDLNREVVSALILPFSYLLKVHSEKSHCVIHQSRTDSVTRTMVDTALKTE